MKRTGNELKLSFFHLVGNDGVIFSGEWSQLKKYLPKSTLIKIIKVQAAARSPYGRYISIDQKVGSDRALEVQWAF